MSSRQRLSLVLVAAGVVAVGIATEWLRYRSRFGLVGQLDLLTGLAIAGCGLLAWARVPRSRVGPLLVAVGISWFMGTAADDRSDLGRLATALTLLYAGFLAHALFTFPSGRMSRPLERLLVAGGYAVALLPPLWAHNVNVAIVAGLLESGLIVRYATTARGARFPLRYSTALGTLLAIAFASKGFLASWIRQARIAFPSDAETIAEFALIVVAFGLAWSLLVLERRRLEVTDLVVEIGAEGGDPLQALLENDGQVDPVLAAAAERAAVLSTRNASLRAELAGQVVNLEASRRRLLEAGDDERAALEAVLRSGAMARLADVAQKTANLAPDLGAVAPDTRPHIDRAADQLRRTLGELDGLARGLDPGLLAERGLDGALRELGERSSVPVELAVESAVRPASTAVAATLYYVASEALANVARHANAKHAWLELTSKRSRLVLVVEDDGVGGASVRHGGGLVGLQDRLDALGGSLSVGARAGGGTRLVASIPVAPTRSQRATRNPAVAGAGTVAGAAGVGP